MSLLNRPSDGMLSVLVVLFNLLLKGAQSRDFIVDVCSPVSVVKDKSVEQTLNTWIKLGMFHEAPDGKLSIHQDVRKVDRDPNGLPSLVARFILRASNNANYWGNENSGAADFTRAVSWLLAQDVYTTELTGWQSAQDRLTPQGAISVIANDTRWSGLKEWVAWLGFGWVVKASGVLCIDPTQAIRGFLPQVFGNTRTRFADEVVSLLAKELPVLDGGEYRTKMETRLMETTAIGSWRSAPPGQLSTSLSRSILRLIADGTLEAGILADNVDRRVRLTGRNQKKTHEFSQFTLK